MRSSAILGHERVVLLSGPSLESIVAFEEVKLLNDDDALYYTMRTVLEDGEYTEYFVTPGDSSPPSETPLAYNQDDGLYYELRAVTEDGHVAWYIIEPGGASPPTNPPRIKNDDFGIWHEIQLVTEDGVPTIVFV